jgi:hypothetical protein
LKHNKRKSMIEFLITFVLLLVLLCSIGAYLYIDILAYHFSWHRDAFLICLELFLVGVGVVEIIRLLYLIKRPISVQSSGEMRIYGEDQSDEYRRQMQLLCSLLAVRADRVLRASQQQQQRPNEDTWNGQF